MSTRIVDLRSDTLTQPTEEMRARMSSAVVGDDVYGEDPTVNELESKIASMFGKEAGLFVASGTMGNLLAIMVHCPSRGSEIIIGDQSHVFLYEQGGPAQLAGVQVATIKNEIDGTFSLAELQRKIRIDDIHEPITSLVVVENTHNVCGGKVVPLSYLDELVSIVRRSSGPSIALHMDGARIFNAAAALGVSVQRLCRDFDSVSICLSKGLSAPIGSILVGSKAFITQARRFRKAVGGGMRQVGVLAAAGLVALEQIVPLLGKDHERTKRIAKAVHDLSSPNVVVDLDAVQTNILFLEIKQPDLVGSEFVQDLENVQPDELRAGVKDKNGLGVVVRSCDLTLKSVRLVLYHQIDDEQVELAIKKLTFVIKQYDARWPKVQ
ncbi:uncharacterized protein Dwil_GK21059 [Drosophila willistoni]|uniref:Aromatic amino acid beta-eliminating lyase/threonine aldolase domain-containing protein n=1 Tax=Drosophila willistoni TaxID=7260 RepID=B4N7A9_DROWI|nr:uncharacterized protein Dwil_GK21059 [Drosophila willistoni]